MIFIALKVKVIIQPLKHSRYNDEKKKLNTSARKPQATGSYFLALFSLSYVNVHLWEQQS